jgi:hypothetical protein
LAGRDGSGTYRTTGFSTTLINDSLWHHILGIVQGNTWLLYVDCDLEGAQSNAVVGPDISSNANLGIGKDVFSNQKFLDCEVDEVRIYNRVLNSDERDSLCATAVFAGIESIQKKEMHLNVYPNPAKDQIAITAENSLENTTIQFFDLSGQLVLETALNAPTPIVNISELEAGTYILRVIQDNHVASQRFVKE